MKKLVLLRHAKAVSSFPGGTDKTRPLSGRGHSDASALGIVLGKLSLDYALVSAAIRTKQTFLDLGLNIPVEYQDALYNCSSQTLLQRISETEEKVQGLLVVGHSPAVPTLSSELSYCAPEKVTEIASWFPTATFAVFEFNNTWQSLADLGSVDIHLVGLTRR